MEGIPYCEKFEPVLPSLARKNYNHRINNDFYTSLFARGPLLNFYDMAFDCTEHSHPINLKLLSLEKTMVYVPSLSWNDLE